MSWLLIISLLLVVIKWADRYLAYNVMIINNNLLLVVLEINKIIMNDDSLDGLLKAKSWLTDGQIYLFCM